MGMFKRKRRSAPAQADALASGPALSDQILWGEVSTAIGAASIVIRGGGSSSSNNDDERPPIVQFVDGGGFPYEKEQAKTFLKALFPEITDALMAKALRYLHTRVIQYRRQVDAAASQLETVKRRWSASEW